MILFTKWEIHQFESLAWYHQNWTNTAVPLAWGSPTSWHWQIEITFHDEKIWPPPSLPSPTSEIWPLQKSINPWLQDDTQPWLQLARLWSHWNPSCLCEPSANWSRETFGFEWETYAIWNKLWSSHTSNWKCNPSCLLEQLELRNNL